MFFFRDNISRLLHSMINDEYNELQHMENTNNTTNTNNIVFSSRNLESYNIHSLLSDTITSFTSLFDNVDDIFVQVFTINTSALNNDDNNTFSFLDVFDTEYTTTFSQPVISIEDINNLHKRILTESIECYICLDKLLPGSCVTQLPCKHEYCFDCIKQWLNEYNTTCPICKKNVK